METKVYNQSGQETGKLNLPGVFETKISTVLLHEVTVGYLANQRSGSHSTKTRAEVSGSGRKPWKQKGTGNARAGSSRSPLWRKGGIIFGPKPRDYSQKISKQKKRLSLKMALTVKANENNILILDELLITDAKTKKMYEILKKLKLEGKKVIIAVDKTDENLRRAAHNIQGVVITTPENLNAYQVLWANTLIFTSAAMARLEKKEIAE